MKLTIKDLEVKIGDKIILSNFNFDSKPGDVIAIMGPNGSGKSTFSKVLLGHPKYIVTKGDILINDKSILKLTTDERARLGIFLGFQNPYSVEGLKFSTFLFQIAKKSNPKLRVLDFKRQLRSYLKELKIDESFVERDLNKGFSGGEKKKAETLQLLFSNAELIVLDEIDSGLDIDSMKLISELVRNDFNKSKTLILITHYQRLLTHIKPNKVVILINGSIVKKGSSALVEEIEAGGYKNL